MATTLQQRFLHSRGADLLVDNHVVSQLVRIPIRQGTVKLQFSSPGDGTQGLCIKAKGGTILMTDGTFTESLHIWNAPNLPIEVAHRVNCPTNELLVWNIYRVQHPTGEMTIDYWTGNAGMVLLREAATCRRYGCSDWRTPFEPTAIVFDVSWYDEKSL
jgi:hypothetical protein